MRFFSKFLYDFITLSLDVSCERW